MCLWECVWGERVGVGEHVCGGSMCVCVGGGGGR